MILEWTNFAYPDQFSLNFQVDESYCFYEGAIEDAENPYGYEDPCLLYYNEFGDDPSTGATCAQCKYNSIRITTKLSGEDGPFSTLCGSTAYNPDTEDAFDSILAGELTYECKID